MLVTLVLLPLNLYAATITATTDRNPVQLNESFMLIFEATGSVDDDPDFEALKKDFDILNQSQSSNISIINGSTSRNISWTLNLMAKREGLLTIPSIPFGSDSSPQLRLTVKAADKNTDTVTSDFYAEMEIDKQQHYVQGQIILTQRLYSAHNLSGYELSKLETEGVETVIEKLGEDTSFQTTKGNRPFLVIERHYALFPQKNGKLHIQAVLAQANLRGNRSSMFDPFRNRQQLKRARSEAINIDVLPVAKNYSAQQWLPAKEIQLVEEWSEQAPTFVVGKPITRTLTLLADGLTAAQLPEISLPAINDFKQYPDQPLLNDKKEASGIIGMRQEKIAMIPTRAGNFKLPAISIQWWNTQTGKIETASIAARTINVTAAAGQTGNAQSQSPAPVQAPVTTTSAVTQATGDNTAASSWMVSTIIFAVAWMMTLLAWFISIKYKTRSTGTKKITGMEPSIKQALATLKTACHKNNAEACKQALLDWGKAMFSDRPPHSLGALAKQCDEPLAGLINQLNASLYSSAPQAWSSSGLFEAITQFSDNKQQTTSDDDYTLEPLYK